ncbi:MAG TPA: hypothetical protein PKA64_13520 [Myxococcota bacterium]|nr:hypothetical protein [Myxococcota bacterium]
MFDTAMLEVAIALVFTYLTLALVLTAITEAINQWLSLRSKTLQAALLRLLDDKDTRDDFFKHPLIRSLRESDDNHPSYIPSEMFARTVLEMAAKGRETVPATVADLRAVLQDPQAGIPEQPRLALLALLDEGVTSMDDARDRVAAWFDATMDRASGWYRRVIQSYTRWAALVLVLALDADTIGIARATWTDDALRHELVARAENVVAKGEDLPGLVRKQGAQLEAALAELRADELPLGWTTDDVELLVPGVLLPDHTLPPIVIAGNWLAKLAGLLVSAAAVSLGAPFWFDLLNRLVRLRGTVAPRPTKDGDDAS